MKLGLTFYLPHQYSVWGCYCGNMCMCYEEQFKIYIVWSIEIVFINVHFTIKLQNSFGKKSIFIKYLTTLKRCLPLKCNFLFVKPHKNLYLPVHQIPTVLFKRFLLFIFIFTVHVSFVWIFVSWLAILHAIRLLDYFLDQLLPRWRKCLVSACLRAPEGPEWSSQTLYPQGIGHHQPW